MSEPPKQVGAVRTVQVPSKLAGRTDDEIVAWAREMLGGQDAQLKQPTIRQIREGEIKEVILRPKRPGFFLPDGSFVEAFDTEGAFGDDLVQAEKETEEEERDWQWVDGENSRFNKRATPETRRGSPNTRQLWEHGKRLSEYAKDRNRSETKLTKLLAERGDARGYGSMTHETALELYRWRPEADLSEPFFGWSWQLVDAILKFSNSIPVRNYVASVVNLHLLPAGASQQSVTYFLRGENPQRAIWKQDSQFLASIKQRLHSGSELDSTEITRLTEQFRVAVATDG
jgi:hypothetical protein